MILSTYWTIKLQMYCNGGTSIRETKMQISIFECNNCLVNCLYLGTLDLIAQID